MTYYDFMDNDRFGVLWYRAELQNHFRFTYSAAENLELGPQVVVELVDYQVCAAGEDLGYAVEALGRLVTQYAVAHEDLPRYTWRDRLRFHWQVTVRQRLLHPVRFLRLRAYARSLQSNRVRVT